MSSLIDDKTFQQIIHRIHPNGKLLRRWTLTGGVSAQVTAVEFEQIDGQHQKVVVRQHGTVDLQHNPHIANDEFKLLNLLHTVGMTTPKAYWADESGDILPSPYIVIEFIDGETVFTPADLTDYVTQAATHLSRLHCVDWSRHDISFLPAQTQKYANRFRERPVKIDNSIGEGSIRDILEGVWPLQQHNMSRLLHGDYWPGNILWKAGQIAAVIDWEDACVGDPLEDLANSRLEILWVFGEDAMTRFTAAYQHLTVLDYANLPYWDLCAALRPAFKISEWATDAAAEKIMRNKHQGFVTQAIQKLANNSQPR